MSSFEYQDLFLNAQYNKDAKYHMFCFDIVSSSKMNTEKRISAQYDLIFFISEFKKEINKLEKKYNKKILIDEKEISSCFDLNTDPCIVGDTFVITIYNSSASREEILSIFNNLVSSRKIDYSFHIADGLYETNNYREGGSKLYRGYCMQILSSLNKDKYSSVAKKMK